MWPPGAYPTPATHFVAYTLKHTIKLSQHNLLTWFWFSVLILQQCSRGLYHSLLCVVKPALHSVNTFTNPKNSVSSNLTLFLSQCKKYHISIYPQLLPSLKKDMELQPCKSGATCTQITVFIPVSWQPQKSLLLSCHKYANTMKCNSHVWTDPWS